MKAIRWIVTRKEMELAVRNIVQGFEFSSIKPVGQSLEDFTKWYIKGTMKLTNGITVDEMVEAVKVDHASRVDGDYSI
ncbi:MAG: hypothetical protein ABIO63_08940 [Casimicrobiaceae bacterium]